MKVVVFESGILLRIISIVACPVIISQGNFSNKPSLSSDARENDACASTAASLPKRRREGLEYSWGKSKREFRQLNDRNPKHPRDNVLKAFKYLPLARVFRFARKPRTYMRAYARVHKLFGYTEEDAKGVHGFSQVERIRKHSKTHRCTMDKQDLAFCVNPEGARDGARLDALIG